MAEGGFAVCVALVAKQKPGNPLKRSVELSQILICLMRGRSFWRGGAQRCVFWLDRLLWIISRFDNSADAVRGAARRVNEGKAVGSLPDRRLCCL